MNKLWKVYLPALTAAFAVIVLYAAADNLVRGDTKDGFLYFVLEAAGYLAVAGVVDFLVGKINFKRYISHCLAEAAVLYPVTIGTAIWGNWFALTPINIAWYSCLYAAVMAAMHYCFYRISKKQANEINELLNAGRREQDGRPG